MNTKTKTLRTYLFSTFGLLAMAVLLVAVNMILGGVNVRMDCTEENVHTLAGGTRKVLGELADKKQNIAVRFYYSHKSTEMPVELKNYARRIEDLLKEYKRYGRDRLTVTVLDPEPDSDAEESARVDGVRPVRYGFDTFYFGIAIACLDEVEAMSELRTDRENALEYEITRAIYRVANPDKPRIGVISSLPIMGSGNDQNPMMAMRGMGRTPPWAFVEYLKQDYELEEVPADSDVIAGEFKALLIVHPKGLSDKMLYAIDQYLLGGGRVLAFLDPLSILGQQRPNQQMMGMPPPPDEPSSLGPLLDAWGVELAGTGGEPGVLADTRFMLRFPSPVPGQPDGVLPSVLDLTDEAINQDELAVGDLTFIRMVCAGGFRFKGDTGLTRANLISSSDKAGFTEPYQAKALDPVSGGRLRDSLKIDNISYPLAVRLEGTFTTAFPDGKPSEPKEEGKEGEEKAPAAAGLKQSAEPGHVILIADSDLLGNPFAFRPPMRNSQGAQVYVPANSNLSLVYNLLDWLVGSKDLISLRSREIKRRPLQRFRDMLSDAQEEYQAEQKRLEEEHSATVEKLQKLLEKNPPVAGQRYHLSPEMADEIKNLEKKRDETEKRKKELRKQYRAGVEGLKKHLMFLNIGLMPILVAVAGIVLALVKRRRTVRK